MKKRYTKPDIVFESFSLSSSIASCDVKIENSTGGLCGLQMDDAFLFVIGVTGCELHVEDGGFNRICYHVPFGEKNMFNS